MLCPTQIPCGSYTICVVTLFIVSVFSRQRIWSESDLLPTAAADLSQDLLESRPDVDGPDMKPFHLKLAQLEN